VAILCHLSLFLGCLFVVACYNPLQLAIGFSIALGALVTVTLYCSFQQLRKLLSAQHAFVALVVNARLCGDHILMGDNFIS